MDIYRGEHDLVRFEECNFLKLLHTIGDLKIKAYNCSKISVRDSSKIKYFSSDSLGFVYTLEFTLGDIWSCHVVNPNIGFGV